MWWRRLDTRIVALFLSLLLLIQLATLAAIRATIERSAGQAVAGDLATGEKVLRQLLDQKAVRLTESARLLAADFGFRDAIATSDSETIGDALLNQANRIGANGALFADARFELKASTGDDTARLLPKVKALASKRSQDAGRLVVDRSGADLLVTVPVRAPVVIGWIALRFSLNRVLLSDLESLTGVKGTILIGDLADPSHWLVHESLLPPDQARHLADRARADPRAATVMLEAGLPASDAAGRYGLRLAGLGEDDGRSVTALLIRSTAEATAPYRRLQWALLGLTALGAGLFAVGSWFTARRVTRPIKQLTRSAERLGAGDYDTPIEATGDDEVGELARRFEQMRVDIRGRDLRISRLAYWDELTGLPNRAQFLDRLGTAIDEARPTRASLSVLMLDVDRFKQINDVLGQAFGDRLLCLLAERLRAELVRPEELVARLGGDEFAVLLPGMGTAGALAVATRVGRLLDRPVSLDDNTVDLAAGIGVASWPADGDTPELLLTHVEAALHAAKSRQAGVVVYDPALDANSDSSLSLLTEFRAALEHGHLELHLQPKVSLATGRVEGAEALVRWRHPARGLIPPIQFVPFLEQTGQIRLLTHWVLARSAAIWCELAAQGRKLQIAVNLSARDLMDQDFPAKLRKLLAGHRLDAGALSLEITESAMMDDPQRAMQTLASLHDMGIALSIDDFGTGYSSLAYLKRLPVSTLKIDRSFVMNMESEPADAQIVRSTIDLAHNLGLTVVAEGIETIRTWNLLRQLGCDVGQGYLIARPLPLPEFPSWVDRWQPPASDGSAGPGPRLEGRYDRAGHGVPVEPPDEGLDRKLLTAAHGVDAAL